MTSSNETTRLLEKLGIDPSSVLDSEVLTWSSAGPVQVYINVQLSVPNKIANEYLAEIDAPFRLEEQ